MMKIYAAVILKGYPSRPAREISIKLKPAFVGNISAFNCRTMVLCISWNPEALVSRSPTDE